MATHDYNIANQGFPAFRADLNDALAAIVSNNSNATAPATTFAHMVWVDTAADPSILKIRNADNDAWITIGSINQTDDKFKLTPADGISTDTISELTSAAGVTVDGVLLKDSGVGSAASPVSLNSLNYPTEGSVNFRNRIINGDMRIDQRNAGAAVTGNGDFPVDRFQTGNGTDGSYSAQQDSSAPTGFVNSVKITTTTADGTLTTTQAINFGQRIEGTNIADLGWGTANAKTVTLSFWVRSSLTGTFGGGLRNSALNRSYPFTYSISVADTWEYKTVTIAGDTSGTWLTTTGVGLRVDFSLGSGPDRSGTAGAWNSNNNISATGAVSVIGTLNATWYITGVQLEVGSVATPFERRPYGTELSLCQRYYEKSYAISVTPGTGSIIGNAGGIFTSSLAGSTAGNVSFAPFSIPFKVTKRAAPTMVLYDFDGTANAIRIYPADAKKTGVTAVANITETGSFQFLSFDNSSATAITAGNGCAAGWTSSAEL